MSERNREPYASVLDLVGWTPLVRLQKVVDGCRTPVYAKCEFLNPADRSRTASGSP